MSKQPLAIAGLKIDPPVFLAPMAGYTDSAMRSICLEHHCGAVYTEVANAQGIMRDNAMTLHFFSTLANEHPLFAHLYGSDAEVLVRAAQKAVSMRKFDAIDLNCGCPVRKIVSKGSGAALMRDPRKIEKIVQRLHSEIDLPITVKTRIGLKPNSMNVEDIARAAEQGGASAIAVHGRFASQEHKGEVNWQAVENLKNIIHIPVIGNGGIKTAEQACELLTTSPVDGIMIGRAAVGNPWLFKKIHAILNGLPFSEPDIETRKRTLMEQFERALALKMMDKRKSRKKVPPEVAAVLHFRAHLYRYLQGSPGWTEVRRNLQFVNSRQALEQAIATAWPPLFGVIH